MSTSRFDVLESPIAPGQTLIEASAGTGKTFALTGLVVRLVLEGVDLRRILLVTFTIAATEELTTRVRAGLRAALGAFLQPGSAESGSLEAKLVERFGADSQGAVDRLNAALQTVDEASVFTIHSFCKRVLEQAAFESGAPFTAEFTDDASELFERAVADFWHRHTYDDELLATLFLETDEKELRDHYYNAQRFPGTRVVPDPEDLSVLAEKLETALAELREEWADGERLLRAVRWTKNGFKTSEDAARALDQVAAALDGEIAGNLKGIGRFTEEAVRTLGYKRGREGQDTVAAAEHAVCRACGKVDTVVRQIEAAIIYRFVREVDARYRRLREEARQFTFVDLINRVHEALQPGSSTREQLLATIRSRWSHALIDEFQDTDPVQYDIFRWGFDGQPLVFVGDPKQSIYRFRGADLFAYIDAKRAARAEYMLGTNWRSATQLIEAVNDLFVRPRRPFLFDEIRYERVDAAGRADSEPIIGDGLPPLVWWQLPPGSRGPLSKRIACDMVIDGVVAEIQRLLVDDVTIGDRAIAPRDIAVLVRENRHAVQLAGALRRAGVPSVLSKTGDIFKSLEVAELEYILRAIHRPQDRRAVRTALATDLWGLTAHEIAALDSDDVGAATTTEQLRSWQSAWREHGVLNALRRFIDAADLTARLLRLEDGERRLTNVRHALELLHQAEVERGRGPDELLRWLRAREHQRLLGQEESELRLESDADAVQLVTIHKSKGLQYEIVFAPFLWSVKDPSKKPFPLVHVQGEEDESMVYDLGSDQHERHADLARAEDLAEELRLTYVALTRAKQRCYVAFGPVNFAEASGPTYLLLGHEAMAGGTYVDHAGAAIAEAKARHVKEADSALEAFVAAHSERMTALPIPEKGPRVQLSFDGSGAALNARTIPQHRRRDLTPWTHTSFSGLTAGAYDDLDHTLPEAAPPTAADGAIAFAAGRQAGLCLHEILEEIDFGEIGGTQGREVEQLVAQKLRKYALDEPRHHRAPIDPLRVATQMIEELVDARLPLGGGLLRDLAEQRQIREWRFVLPVNSPSPRKLAEVFRDYGDDGLAASYPELLHRLDDDALARYLSGFADLVFESGERWFVYDWKSNLLGNAIEDYTGGHLAATALSHHYELQLHLYTLGLHRYLKSRLPSYDYDRHMGGGAVVFLRGVRAGTDAGFHARRPSFELISALENTLCG